MIHHERMFMNVHSPTSAGPARDGVGRARRAGVPEVRDRLLGAAARLVAERQSSAITARDIAREAGLSDGALYNHFTDKHELVLEALVGQFEGLVAAFEERVAAIRSTSAERELEALAAATLELHRASLPMLANVVSEPALFHRFMIAIHRPPLGGHVFSSPFEAHVRRHRGAAYSGAADPRAAADVLVGTVLLLGLVEVLGGRPGTDTERRLRAAVRTVVRGLAARP